jgi:hypothetical protein
MMSNRTKPIVKPQLPTTTKPNNFSTVQQATAQQQQPQVAANAGSNHRHGNGKWNFFERKWDNESIISASHHRTTMTTSSSRAHPGPGRSRGDEANIGKYKLLKTIGKGNFAKVGR